MHSYFEVKISYEKVMENGSNKNVNEPYLVDALSFSEAEARAIEKISPYISGEFSVEAVKQSKYHEVFTSEEESADKYYKAKLNFITLDEKSGAEKKTGYNVLIQASDFHDAIKKLDEEMKSTMADYIIVSVSETKIVDIYPYNKTPEESELS